MKKQTVEFVIESTPSKKSKEIKEPIKEDKEVKELTKEVKEPTKEDKEVKKRKNQ